MATGERPTTNRWAVPKCTPAYRLADHFAVDELDAIRIGRRIVAWLNLVKRGPGHRDRGPAPLADEELLDRPADLRILLRIRVVTARAGGRRVGVRRIQTALRSVTG